MAGEYSVVLAWLPQPMGGMQLIHQSFFDSIWALAQTDGGEGGRRVMAGYVTAQTSYIAAGREQVIREFMKTDIGEWLLMLDWDITFTADDVYKLLDYAADDWSKIVSGCYVTWFGADNALRPCWMSLGPDGENIPVTTYDSDAVVPLATVGMGFTLIHRQALELMERASNDDPWPWFGHDAIMGARTGEDVTFCDRARRCGLTVWGHGGVQLGHTKAKRMYPQDIFNTALAFAHNNTGKTVLNVGGGTKAIPIPADYDGWSVVLLDVEEGPDVDVVGDMRDMPCEPDSFDAVYCSHALEHLEAKDHERTLRGFRRALRPGGHVRIRVPDIARAKIAGRELGWDTVLYVSASGPITALDIVKGHQASIDAGADAMRHRSALTAERLENLLRRAGFVSVTTSVSIPGWEIQAIATKPRDKRKRPKHG